MRTLRKIWLVLTLLFPLWAHAVGEPYTQARMDALNQAGKPVLLLVHANWCSTCRAQDTVLRELLPRNEFRSITALRVDFDDQKPVVRALGVRYQSTLIVFNKGKEIDRVTAETSSAAIAALLRRAL